MENNDPISSLNKNEPFNEDTMAMDQPKKESPNNLTEEIWLEEYQEEEDPFKENGRKQHLPLDEDESEKMETNPENSQTSESEEDDGFKPVEVNWYEMERYLKFVDRYALDPNYEGDLTDSDHDRDLSVNNVLYDENGKPIRREEYD